MAYGNEDQDYVYVLHTETPSLISSLHPNYGCNDKDVTHGAGIPQHGEVDYDVNINNCDYGCDSSHSSEVVEGDSSILKNSHYENTTNPTIDQEGHNDSDPLHKKVVSAGSQIDSDPLREKVTSAGRFCSDDPLTDEMFSECCTREDNQDSYASSKIMHNCDNDITFRNINSVVDNETPGRNNKDGISQDIASEDDPVESESVCYEQYFIKEEELMVDENGKVVDILLLEEPSAQKSISHRLKGVNGDANAPNEKAVKQAGNLRIRYSCDHCGKKYSGEKSFDKHMRRFHPESFQFPHNCQMCGKGFMVLHNFESHVKKHAGPDKFNCYICRAAFKSKSDLRYHISKGHVNSLSSKIDEGHHKSLLSKAKIRNFSCDLCESKFTRKHTIKTHKAAKHPHIFSATVKSKRVLRCHISKSHVNSLASKIDEDDHVSSLPSKINEGPYDNSLPSKIDEDDNVSSLPSKINEGPYVNRLPSKIDESCSKSLLFKAKIRNFSCDVCGDNFTRKDSIVKHQAKKHPDMFEDFSSDDSFPVCRICGKTCESVSSLATHKLEHKKPPYKCNICNSEFKSRSYLKGHVMIHLVGKPTCDICGRGFCSVKEMKRHSCVHNVEINYLCEVCGEGFSQRRGFSNHMRIHTNVPIRKPIKCKVCDKPFRDNGNLASHMNKHTGSRSHICNICGKGLGDKRTLKMHVACHKGEKQYKCPICEKTFAYASYRSSHMRSHTKEKPFQCQECNKCFSQKSSLNTHLKSHSGEKKYCCIVCNKSFVLLSYLKIHMRIHTGERPYKCPSCEKDFTQSSSLKTHMQSCQ